MTRSIRWIGVFVATMLAVALPATGEINGAADEQNRHPLIRVSTVEIACAHFADGQDWTTEFVFVNMSEETRSAILFFYNSDGDSQQVSFKNGMSKAVYDFTLPPHGSHRLETLGGRRSLTQGFVKLIPTDQDGYIAGTAIFRRELPDIPTYEASVTFGGLNDSVEELEVMDGRVRGKWAYLPFDHRNGYTSGVAVANLHAHDEIEVLGAFADEAGEIIYIDGRWSFVLELPGNNHRAFDLTKEFPETIGKVGVLRVKRRSTTQTNRSGIQLLGFRFSPEGPFSTIEPVVSDRALINPPRQ